MTALPTKIDCCLPSESSPNPASPSNSSPAAPAMPVSPTSASQPRRFGFQVIPEISQLSPFVIRLCGLNPSSFCLKGTNIYLLGDGEERLIIDAGSRFDTKTGMYYYSEGFAYSSDRVMENLVAALRSTGAKRVQHILVTHYHYDHTGGLDSMVKVLKEFNDSNDNEVQLQVWKADLTQRGDVAESMKYSEIDSSLNLTWKIAGSLGEEISVKPFRGPGHTSDSIGFLMLVNYAGTLMDSNCSSSPYLTAPEEFIPKRNLRILFCGDTMLGEGTSVYADAVTYVETLRRMRIIPMDVIFPGHGPVIKQPQSAIRDYIELIQFKEKKLLTLITEASKSRKGSTDGRINNNSSSYSHSPTLAGLSINQSTNSNSSSSATLVSGLTSVELVNKFYMRLDAELFGPAKRVIDLHLAVLEKAGRIKRITQENSDGMEEDIFCLP